ncbi:hypothetical protein AB0M02_14135 [Actinoplanes sp. NPDC051861]|uniref:hypothetical protein n=1 Tax=Actinoplanes sp. NPDC051861 TaxID=3155170 RepID=UPI00343E08DC
MAELATWAEVDPRLHPFDPAEVADALRMTAPPRPEWCDGGWVSESAVWEWVSSVGAALATRYGAWAYRWHWAPDAGVRVIDRLPRPAEVPAFVTDELVKWRRWLESLDDQFQRLRPEPGDPVESWEVAIAQLMTRVVARSTGGDDWQRPCGLVLRWFLTENGVPAHEARALVDDAIDERFSTWAYLTVTDIGDISERLARGARGA